MVGTASWLAKKLTSPGNCSELTWGPGQFPPRMQLKSCLCQRRKTEDKGETKVKKTPIRLAAVFDTALLALLAHLAAIVFLSLYGY